MAGTLSWGTDSNKMWYVSDKIYGSPLYEGITVLVCA